LTKTFKKSREHVEGDEPEDEVGFAMTRNQQEMSKCGR